MLCLFTAALQPVRWAEHAERAGRGGARGGMVCGRGLVAPPSRSCRARSPGWMAAAGVRLMVTATGGLMKIQVMFLDCPAYLNDAGSLRCGLPAEVEYRYLQNSSDGPLESAKIKCPLGHWFNAPVEYLTWNKNPGTACGSSAGMTDGTASAPRPGKPGIR